MLKELNHQKYVLNISFRTFLLNNDCKGIFDYTSNSTKNFNALVPYSIFAVKKGKKIKFISQQSDIEDDEEILFNVRNDLINEFILENPIFKRISELNADFLYEKIWFLVRNSMEDHLFSRNGNSDKEIIIGNTNKDYELSENDVIKFGREIYIICELKLNQSKDENEKDNLEPAIVNEKNEIINNNYIEIINDSIIFPGDNICRICLDKNCSQENPLINLCHCDGSLKYIHYNCIKEWIKTNCNNEDSKENSIVKTYSYRKYCCEMCHTPYPIKFKLSYNNEKIYNLINYELYNETNFIVLESINNDLNNKIIHVIKLNKYEIFIGRDKEKDLVLNDCTISRTHAKFIYNSIEKKLILKDLGSRYGTMVLIKNQIKINEQKLSLQVGNTYIEVILKENNKK